MAVKSSTLWAFRFFMNRKVAITNDAETISIVSNTAESNLAKKIDASL